MVVILQMVAAIAFGKKAGCLDLDFKAGLASIGVDIVQLAVGAAFGKQTESLNSGIEDSDSIRVSVDMVQLMVVSFDFSSVLDLMDPVKRLISSVSLADSQDSSNVVD